VYALTSVKMKLVVLLVNRCVMLNKYVGSEMVVFSVKVKYQNLVSSCVIVSIYI